MLDVVLIKDRRIMLLSVDNVHAPSSMNRPVPRMHQPCIHAFNLKIDHRDPDWQYEWVRFYPAFEDISGIAPGSFRDIANKFSNPLWLKDMEHEIEIEEAIKPNALYSSLGEFLYGSENLRKKFQEEGEAQREDKIAGSEHAEI